MSGLLDFALGFGFGSAGGYAEQKKADIQAQREANLARLRAKYGTEQAKELHEYKTEQEQEQFQSAIGDLTPEEQRQAKLARVGVSTQQETYAPSSLMKEAMAVHPDDPEAQREYITKARNKPDTVVNLSEGDRGNITMEALLKQDAEKIEAIENRLNRAQSQVAQADRLEAALEGTFKTGIAAPPVKVMSQIATYAGLDPEDLGLGSAATADTIEAASKTLAANLIGDITDNSSMRGSAALMRYLEEAGPMLTRTPEGNKVIVEVMRRAAERDIEAAQLADDYISNYGTLRPEGEKSYTRALIDLNKKDPVITEQLRERIATAKDAAPKGNDLVIETQEIPTLDITYGQGTPQDLAAQLLDAGLGPGQQWRDKNGALHRVPNESILKQWGVR